jgi:GNAT superfamily N-acetyltransferase
MSYRVRSGRADDLARLAAFTKETFRWGDYVADAYLGWLDDPAIEVLVVEHAAEGPVAMAALKQPGPHQAWLAAARVHPDHRRRGLASLMNDTAVEWARERGDRVARLLIEDWNEAPQRQVEALGFRRTSRWLHASRSGLLADPNPTTNGGPRVPGPERLEPASRVGAVDAWPVWERAGITRAARGLIGRHWMWWRLTPDDLARFAADGLLWSCPSGWVVAEVDDGTVVVEWLCPHGDDVRRLTKACVDLAVEHRCDTLEFIVPDHPSARAAVERLSMVPESMSIWEKPL